MSAQITLFWTRFITLIKTHRIGTIVAVMGLYFGGQKLMLHAGFQTGFYDLYFFDQSIWNVTQGKGLYLSTYDGSFLGLHFYPWLYLLAPLYWIKATPFWIFGVHVGLLLTMAYPILKLAEINIGRHSLKWVTFILIAYLPFRNANLHDLHGEILLAAVLAWVIYAIIRKKPILMWGLIAVIPFIKESSIVVMGGLALLFFVQKQWKKALCILVYGGMVSGVLIESVMPNISQDDYMFLKYYGYLGETLFEQIKTIVTRPDIVIKNCLKGYKIGYFLVLILPVGGLCLLSPYFLIGFGTLAQNILSNKMGTCDIMAHYSIPLVPVIIISAIMGYKVVQSYPIQWKKRALKWGKGCAIFFIGLNILVWGVLELRHFYIEKDTLKGHAYLETQIPKSAKVSASSQYFVHLHYRDNMVLFPEIKEAAYVVVEKADPFWPIEEDHTEHVKKEWRKGEYKAVIKALLLGERSYSPTNRKTYYKALKALEENPNYSQIGNSGPLLIYKAR